MQYRPLPNALSLVNNMSRGYEDRELSQNDQNDEVDGFLRNEPGADRSLALIRWGFGELRVTRQQRPAAGASSEPREGQTTDPTPTRCRSLCVRLLLPSTRRDQRDSVAQPNY